MSREEKKISIFVTVVMEMDFQNFVGFEVVLMWRRVMTSEKVRSQKSTVHY